MKPSIKRTVTIPANGDESGVIDKSNYRFMSIVMPSAWNAGDISFLGSMSRDGTFVPIVKGSDGAELTLTVDANEIIVMDTEGLHNLVMAVPFIKLVSSVSQDAEREFEIALFE